MKTTLQLVVKLKGSCTGVTATQIDRTEFKALYHRSDGYFECFFITATRLDIFTDGHWIKTGDMIERYPGDEKFGITAWCGKEKSIRARYQDMNADMDAVSAIHAPHFFQRSIES